MAELHVIDGSLCETQDDSKDITCTRQDNSQAQDIYTIAESSEEQQEDIIFFNDSYTALPKVIESHDEAADRLSKCIVIQGDTDDSNLEEKEECYEQDNRRNRVGTAYRNEPKDSRSEGRLTGTPAGPDINTTAIPERRSQPGQARQVHGSSVQSPECHREIIEYSSCINRLSLGDIQLEQEQLESIIPGLVICSTSDVHIRTVQIASKEGRNSSHPFRQSSQQDITVIELSDTEIERHVSRIGSIDEARVSAINEEQVKINVPSTLDQATSGREFESVPRYGAVLESSESIVFPRDADMQVSSSRVHPSKSSKNKHFSIHDVAHSDLDLAIRRRLTIDKTDKKSVFTVLYY